MTRSRRLPEDSLFNCYYAEVWRSATLLSQLFYLPLISTLYCWVLIKEAASTIFWVFRMNRPGIEPRSLGSLLMGLMYWYTEGWVPRGAMAKVRDCSLEVSEFELQPRYYVRFQTNTFGKAWTHLSFQLWVKPYHFCSSTRMALALNNPRNLIYD